MLSQHTELGNTPLFILITDAREMSSEDTSEEGVKRYYHAVEDEVQLNFVDVEHMVCRCLRLASTDTPLPFVTDHGHALPCLR